jgi:hypothetical protein
MKWRVKSINPVNEVFEDETFDSQRKAIWYLGEQVIRYQNDGWKVSGMHTIDDNGSLAVDLMDDNGLERHFEAWEIVEPVDADAPTYYTDGEGFEVWTG